MHLVRLIYASRASRQLVPADIAQILQAAMRNNVSRSLTGMLCFRHDCFLQVLEGGSIAVNELYCRIAGDPRHHNLLLLQYTEITQRDFPDWTMGYVPLDEVSRKVFTRFFPSSKFDPMEMGGDGALAFLRMLRQADVARVSDYVEGMHLTLS
jgi:hypothetical protein